MPKFEHTSRACFSPLSGYAHTVTKDGVIVLSWYQDGESVENVTVHDAALAAEAIQEWQLPAMVAASV